MRYISMNEFLMGRIKMEDLPSELIGNANTIVPCANMLLEKFGSFRACNSGYRSFEDQMKINPKVTKSKHLTCEAVDLEDKDGKLKTFCLANLKLLKDLGLWMEHPDATPTWCHVQCSPPKSGDRVFRP